MVPILNRGRPSPTVFRSIYFINNTPVPHHSHPSLCRNRTMLYRSKMDDNNLIYKSCTPNTHMHLTCFPSPFSIHLASNPCLLCFVLLLFPLLLLMQIFYLLRPSLADHVNPYKMLFYTVNCTICGVKFKITSTIWSILEIVLERRFKRR
jgi:hypothetical protein